ncbi:DNA-directed RNA polymerase subunit B'' [Candidatus Woesearchaeota archaeon]|nr:DNA-directed RNA polymerase subunit B'' [Candidatus Woesearchaeota archaeon]
MNKDLKIDDPQLLLKKFFEENSLIQSDLESFNNFVEEGLNQILEENRIIEPTIIPPNVDDFKIRLDNIWVTKPEITEADGSIRPILPSEARLRKMSYSAPVFMEVSAHINGIQKEDFKLQIGNLPIMLKSKFCHLSNMNKDELIKAGEDPYDPGGYFIINGTEKVLVKIEDLASNRLMIEREATGLSPFVGKVFSERGSYKIPHQFERLKDGMFYLTFTRVKRIPVVLLVKALGMLRDDEIMRSVDIENSNEVFVNLFEFVDIKEREDALDAVAKKIGITQSREIRIQRVEEILDKYLFPHLGITEEDRMFKAVNVCRYLKQYIQTIQGKLPTTDKDHYANKRLKLSGDLLADLFRVNMKVLIGDLLYNFQRIVKRGKIPSIKVIIREKLLTQRIYSSMATGNWVGNRTGVSQRISRQNFLELVSSLQRVVSPLSSSQENFEARALHSTHLGRLCPSETPEGSNIGLRKNMAILASVSQEVNEEELVKSLKTIGLETI